MESPIKLEGSVSILTVYRSVLIWCLVAILVAQVFLVTMMSFAGGWTWYWVLPLTMAVILPFFRGSSRTLVNAEGISVDASEVLAWDEIDRVERASDFWLVVLLRSGKTRILLFEDWPEPKKEELLSELRSRRLLGNGDG